MLVITALVGTHGLEQETLVAISKVRPGEGVVAGLGIAFLSIILDRLIGRGSILVLCRLGLSERTAIG
jgi:glycine betaine/proline transport system permease protein